jgi:hypothetical protein
MTTLLRGVRRAYSDSPSVAMAKSVFSAPLTWQAGKAHKGPPPCAHCLLSSLLVCARQRGGAGCGPNGGVTLCALTTKKEEKRQTSGAGGVRCDVSFSLSMRSTTCRACKKFCFSAGDMDARFSVSEASGLPIGKAKDQHLVCWQRQEEGISILIHVCKRGGRFDSCSLFRVLASCREQDTRACFGLWSRVW